MPVIIVAAAIAAVAAIIGAAIAAGENAKAMAIRLEAAAKYGDIKLPVIDRIVAQNLNPDDASRYLKATQSTQAQGDVLGKMMEIVNEQGETSDDRASYLRMRNEAGGIASGAQSAVQRQMENRGMGDSGMSFALQQQGAQSAANRANAMGIESASAARSRYVDALGMSGQMAGQMRGQEMSAMKSMDEVNMFNARQQSDADYRNQSIPQQDFDNRMALASQQAAAMNGVAGGYERQAQGTQNTASGVGNAVLTAGAAYDQYGNPVDPKKPKK